VAKFIDVVTVNQFAQSNHQRSFRNHVRANDVSLRSRAHIREGIAGHERQNCVAGTVERFGVLRGNHLSEVHPITEAPIQCFQGDFIVFPDVAQRSKERVSVSCERYIARLARERGSGNVSDSSPQSFPVNAFHDHG